MKTQDATLLDRSVLTTTSLQTQPLGLSTGVMAGLQTNIAKPSAAAMQPIRNSDNDPDPSDPVSPPKPPRVPSDPGSTLGTARNIGTLAGVVSINQAVGASDTIDFYRFQINNDRLHVNLTGLASDIDLQVIRDVNGNGLVEDSEILARSTRGGTGDEAIDLAGLSSGDYFVKVFQYSGDSTYTFRLSNATTNDLLGVETTVVAFSGYGGLNTQVFSGQIDNNNTSDVFKITSSLLFPGINAGINISLSGLSSDLDVRLIQDANSNGIVDSSDIVAYSSNGSNRAERINLSTPGSGLVYFVQVNQFAGSSSYHLGVSTGDWFSDNLSDDEIMGESRYAQYNGFGINRTEMIGILRSAKDYGTIDATEINDLQKLVANATGLGMPDYVRELSYKIVNGDLAHRRPGGVGDLVVGSSDTQMENMIGKWFYGTDRPTPGPGITYNYASGSLFQDGIKYTDIIQGNVGDCYLLADLAAVALQKPSAIRDMFIDNYDGTFTVRYFHYDVAHYVTVDRYLPTDGNGLIWGAKSTPGVRYDDASNELWVALAEKAYAQISQSSWTGKYNKYNTYLDMNGGNAMHPLDQIIGGTVRATANAMDLTKMQNAFIAGQSIALHSVGVPAVPSDNIAGDHVYAFMGWNLYTGLYSFYNPWGKAVELTGAQVMRNFSHWVSIA